VIDELNERDLCRVRLRFLDLIKSFFVEEPDAEKMSRWRGTFSALAREQVSPRFDKSVREISRALQEKSLKDLKNEYYHLFGNPCGGALVETSASYYRNGRSYSRALADVRGLMAEAGLCKDPEVFEPEDSLVVMLDTFASMVEEEQRDDGLSVRQLQSRLLEEFLEPLAEHMVSVLDDHQYADFYTCCCRVLCCYLELEKGLVAVET
jgi:TorA maturation chaperone TorD